jgi:ABC-type Mn2+/Zn2+ transport system ATPase subunit
MIAYLKMIRTKRHINILFLDEVFSSIDLEGIESILLLLKDFANNYKISIFVVHHALMSGEFFDRIISVNKDVFSQITETATREDVGKDI